MNNIMKVFKQYIWITIKEFEFVEYTDACDCFRYCTDPYLL